MNVTESYDLWRKMTADEPDLKAELDSIEGDEAAIYDRFFCGLDFGTGGLRGVIGAGANRMNVFTVACATQGYANYLLDKNPAASVAIAYDSRIKSDVFARTAAGVMAASGVRVFIYPELMPTPMLSFAVRTLKCDGGIVVTASHNPAKYNGYKVYAPDGCQLLDDDSRRVIEYVERVDVFGGVKRMDFDEAVNSGRICYIGNEINDAFYAAVEACEINKGLLSGTDLKVLYTPLNGTGNKPVRTVLGRLGLGCVDVVKAQELPDGNFPTAPFPNPEIREAFNAGFEQAAGKDYDLLIATDPDADRAGIAVGIAHGTKEGYKLMSGNEVGALLMYYTLKQRRAQGTLPENPVCVKTIVSTDMCFKIAAEFGAELREVLTGFKYIGEQITMLHEQGRESDFVMGFEESYGYLTGTHVREKDAVNAASMICEMAAWYKAQGKTLIDAVNELYQAYGYYVQSQISFTCEGAEGLGRMKDIMQSLRADTPKTVGGLEVESVADYDARKKTDLPSGTVSDINLPRSNVLTFALKGGAKAIVRPSGTEPKIKVYLMANESTPEGSESVIGRIGEDMSRLMGF